VSVCYMSGGTSDIPTGVFDILPSFLGIGESFRVDSEEGTRGSAYINNAILVSEARVPPPPEPVRLIASPPELSVPGTGDCADDLEAPTLRICARTRENWRSYSHAAC
jgi:hypothetical protein